MAQPHALIRRPWLLQVMAGVLAAGLTVLGMAFAALADVQRHAPAHYADQDGLLAAALEREWPGPEGVQIEGDLVYCLTDVGGAEHLGGLVGVLDGLGPILIIPLESALGREVAALIPSEQMVDNRPTLIWRARQGWRVATLHDPRAAQFAALSFGR